MNIPEITQKYREQQKQTLQEFGDTLGVTKQAIGQWENNVSLPSGIFLISVAMKCQDWRRDWAWACIEAHPRYQAYTCPELGDTDAPCAGVA